MKPLKRCANGCDAPPDPPSLVICRACIERLGATLRELLAKAEALDAARAKEEPRNG